jgi:hypothetical protein
MRKMINCKLKIFGSIDYYQIYNSTKMSAPKTPFILNEETRREPRLHGEKIK